MGVTCTCGGGHRTFGACLRAKNFSVGYCRSHIDKNPARHDYTSNRSHERELALYHQTRMQGIRPGGTNTAAIRHALDRSDQLGRPYNAAKPLE
jgi:hypothetical protein